MISTIVISILLVALALSIRNLVSRSRPTSSSLSDSDRQLVFDLKVLDRLLSGAEDEYLEKKLPRQEFHRIRRQRALLAFRYLRLVNRHVGQPLLTEQTMGSLPGGEMQATPAIASIVRVKIVIAQIYLLVQCIFPAANLSRWIGGANLCRRLDQAISLQESGSAAAR
jgi:hypothetical protein